MTKASLLFRRIMSLLAAAILTACGLLPIAGAAAEETGVVNTKVVLRKSADKDSKALQTLAKGEEVVLRGSSGSWYKVRYGTYSGYILKKYINVSKNSVVKNYEKIKAIGDPPGPMRVGDDNSDVKKLQKALEILGYYKGRIDGEYGKGTSEAVEKYQKEHELKADGVAGKATVTSIFGSCAKKSFSSQKNDSKSNDDSKSTKKAASTPSSKYKSVSSIAEIGSIPSATKKGDSGTNVVKLQQALECLGYYSGAIDGSYGEGTVAAVKKFQRKRGMNEDGIAGAATIRVIFGKAPAKASTGTTTETKKYKTEVPDWFKDNVSSLIPKNARFIVKDVRTGKTFQCVRWSGINHLDAEPRSAADTAKMKSIFGGEWSWNRRAILVQYNGHVYAASMNGMPHGTTTISGNNFDGHFCIHFLNSKTHETKKVDAEHQNAVSSASKSSW